MKYDKEFKLQALHLSDEIGVKKAAEQLGLKYYTLADWRRLRNESGEQAYVGSGYSKPPVSEKNRRTRELEAKLRKTQRANEILKEALVFSQQAGRRKIT